MQENLQRNNAIDDTAALPGPVFLRRYKQCKGGKTRNRLNGREGFTLVELLVAMTLIVIGVFAVLAMQLTALRANSHAHELAVATAMAQQELEDIMSWNQSDPRINAPDAVAVNYFPDPAAPANNFIIIPGAGTFTTQYSITAGTNANGITQGVTRVVVTVTYPNALNLANTPFNFTVTITGSKRMV